MAAGLFREAVVSVGVWSAGDFFAQFYGAHKHALRRRLEGSEPISSEGRSMAGMMAMLDQPRLGLSAAFGLLISPLVVQHRMLCTRVLGKTEKRMLESFLALAAQQLFMTPLMLLLYHNAMTAYRKGFTDPSFLRAYETGADTRGRYNAMSVERRIVLDVLPSTLVASWLVYMPLALLGYVSAKHARGMCAAVCLIPWTACVSHVQSTLLL
ncbi:hypothetical protein TraAM80_07664 [Trypanosoma rangeli]|uniref:Uncharacterized protein n=1 Tax=Trypanosoma rangeli TaxID=5698 RepID=A0A422N4D7_TRYRA|nr:uncharacterized protein TraAM80_07664 [Trypanosoma rangeli]RNF00339.1 hypothetical protein TraAM80_07664 [Trypanosoma rangeli]|eukprot:RNF00339.1 hypothetical protein TraAM80_07664 [Trypanosoma rangeli]